MRKLIYICLTSLIALSYEVQSVQAAEAVLDFCLPTENDHIFKNKLETFYQPTVSKRAISGMYGFVRTNGPEPPKYFERFHEGIDIKPLRKTSTGIPLDPIVSVQDGIVVYVNTNRWESSYGIYVTVEHEAGPYRIYTLYAHLASASVKTGDAVQKGQKLGVLGYTGSGLVRSRAHLHFEINFQVSSDFMGWYEKYGRTHARQVNHHGNFSGLNLIGVAPAPILEAAYRGKPLTVEQIMNKEKVCFKVLIPSQGKMIYWQKQFPFQIQGWKSGDPLPASWVVHCNRVGMPLRFDASDKKCSEAQLLWFDTTLPYKKSFTRGLCRRRGNNVTLEPRGQRWFSLLCWPHKHWSGLKLSPPPMAK